MTRVLALAFCWLGKVQQRRKVHFKIENYLEISSNSLEEKVGKKKKKREREREKKKKEKKKKDVPMHSHSLHKAAGVHRRTLGLKNESWIDTSLALSF